MSFLMISTLFQREARPPLDAMFEFLGTLVSPARLGSILVEFLPVLLFALGVLAVGRLAHWPAGHLSLPVLGWAYKMTGLLDELNFGYEPGNYGFLIVPFLEGVVALVIVLALVGLAAGAQPPRRGSRIELFCWVSALVAVATVVLDWGFLLLLFIAPL